MFYKNIKAFALILVLLFTITSISPAHASGDVFKLKISTVTENGEAVSKEYKAGDTIYLRVDYKTPYKADFDKAVDGTDSFYLKIISSGLSALDIYKASTIICVDDQCQMSDETDIFDFNGNTANMTYGYDGYILFKTKVTADGDFLVKATLTYGQSVYSESASANVDVKETKTATPAPTSTPKAADKPNATDKPKETDSPKVTNNGTQLPETGGTSLAYMAIVALGAGVVIIGIKKRK
jgi:LPXTG-motif cell wall-anchored protein